MSRQCTIGGSGLAFAAWGMLMGCGGQVEPVALDQPAPEAPSATPVDEASVWPTTLMCPDGAEATEAPSETHPEYWRALPPCSLPVGLDFTKKRAKRADRYPGLATPPGSRHRWCAPDARGLAIYQMWVSEVPIADGDVAGRIVSGSLKNGLAHGPFQLIDPEQRGKWAIEGSGPFVEGKATGRWRWRSESQNMGIQAMCPTSEGELVAAAPVGVWTAEHVDQATTRFEGSWGAGGWQGEVTVTPPGGGEALTRKVVDGLAR